MQDSLVLDVDDACHVLTVETGGPIFSVAVQSGVLLDLEESPVAVLSRSPPDPANGSLTLATYRCCCLNHLLEPASNKYFWLSLRPTAGNSFNTCLAVCLPCLLHAIYLLTLPVASACLGLSKHLLGQLLHSLPRLIPKLQLFSHLYHTNSNVPMCMLL